MTLQKAGEIIYRYIKTVPKAEDWDLQRAARVLRVQPQLLVQAITGAEVKAMIETVERSWSMSQLSIWIGRNGYCK